MSLPFTKICGKCGNRRFFVKRRYYSIPVEKSPITSQTPMCGSCNKDIRKLIGSMKFPS